MITISELNKQRHMQNNMQNFIIFFHPDFNCRPRNYTESYLAARGLYHR